MIFNEQLDRVYWYYGVHQPAFHNQLRSEGIIVEEGLPTNFHHIPPRSIIVMDDLLSETKSAKAVTQLFTRFAHHNSCFVILAVQNMFEKGSELRTQHLNTQYMVIFKNPRDLLQIRILGSQMFPGKNSYLTSVFQNATQKPHGYLFIDTHQNTKDDIRLRTNIFPEERPMIAFMPKA